MIAQQMSLALIPHVSEGVLISQRVQDGYFNATAACSAARKSWAHYLENASTKAYLKELSSDIGIPISELIQSFRGGDPRQQGTWVHPDVAIHLGQWLSPKFAVLVTRWVREWTARGKYAGSGMPYHLARYTANSYKIPYTHFSILNEMTLALIAPLENQGYSLPESMIPDISQGKMFARWLREKKGVNTDAMPTYPHEYADGRIVQAKMYPVELIEEFRLHFNEVWLPQRANDYFAERDPKALPYLPKLLGHSVSRVVAEQVAKKTPLPGRNPRKS